MYYLIDKDTNQIVGTIDNPDENPGNYIVCEEPSTDLLAVYYDPIDQTVRAKPEQPPNTYWNFVTNSWDLLFVAPEPTISTLKETKIAQLNQQCHAEIVSGFVSEALGKPYRYDSEETDQMNLIGSVLLGINVYYVCTDRATGIKAPIEHTNTQLKTVMADGAKMKQDCLIKYHTLVAQVNAAKNEKKLNSINW